MRPRLTDLERAGAALVRWNTARQTAAQLKARRNGLECAIVEAASRDQMQAALDGTSNTIDLPQPCWKARTGNSPEGEWEYARPIAEWCPHCRERQHLHEAYQVAVRRRGALMRVMQRAAVDAAVAQ